MLSHRHRYRSNRVRRRRHGHPAAALVVALAAWIGAAGPLHAQDAEDEEPAPTPPVSIGGGLQTSFLHRTSEDADASDHFRVNSLRMYVNGAATSKIKFMVNTDIAYGGSLGAPGPQDTGFQILDAVAQFEMSDTFNVWVGRFLPPSDRANLYGPFYAHHWAVYADGVQDGYPFVFQGRDNGAAWWGQFDKVKLSAGAFDGLSATGNSSLIGAGRIQVDFWDAEPGYYLNSTYYGERNLLAIGLAGQTQADAGSAYSADFLVERKVNGGGAVSFEAEWARYDQLGGYDPRYLTNDGGYLLAAYLFPATRGRRPVRGARQVRPRPVPGGHDPRLRPDDDRVQPQLRHPAVQRARDDLRQGHRLYRRQPRRLAGRGGAAAADVAIRSYQGAKP